MPLEQATKWHKTHKLPSVYYTPGKRGGREREREVWKIRGTIIRKRIEIKREREKMNNTYNHGRIVHKTEVSIPVLHINVNYNNKRERTYNVTRHHTHTYTRAYN